MSCLSAYTDSYLDTESALHYMNARYYDTELKRFTSVDPWHGELEKPQTLNKYSYVMNNPLKYNDPTGEQYFEVQGEAEFSKRWGGNVSISTLYGLTGKTEVRNLSVGGEITPPGKKSLIKRILGPFSGSATVRLAERPTEVGEVMYGSDADWSLGPFTGSFAVGTSDDSDLAFEPAFGVSTDFGHVGLQGSTGVVTGVTSWQDNIDSAVFGTAEAYSNLQTAVVNRVRELLGGGEDED